MFMKKIEKKTLIMMHYNNSYDNQQTMTSDNNKLKIKIHYENDIRIMSMNSNEINFDETIKYITNNLKLNDNIRLHYVDEDSDVIIISSTDELKEYVLDKTISTHRIHVTLTTDGKTTDGKTIDGKTIDGKTIIINKKHLDNKDMINQIIFDNDFSKLLEYSHFHLDKLFHSYTNYSYTIRTLSEQKNIIIFKHVIDNCVNLECQLWNKWKFIHYICRWSTSEMIKYIIDKNVDLECETYEGVRPIHFICQYSTPEMIKYVIDKNVNLECETREGVRPIHFICQYSTPEMIKYIIDKNVNLRCETKEGKNPLYCICKYIYAPKMLDYVIWKED